MFELISNICSKFIPAPHFTWFLIYAHQITVFFANSVIFRSLLFDMCVWLFFSSREKNNSVIPFHCF